MRYLNQFVHLMVTFRVASESRIPSTILSLMQEPQVGRESQVPTGEQFIDSTKNCALSGFLGQIEARKFEVVGVSCEPFFDRKGPGYYKVRLQFTREDFARGVTDEFKKLRGALRTEFKVMCEDAGWSVIAYDNPYFLDGKRVMGAHSLSINANAPDWLIDGDGVQVLVWDRPKHQEGAQKIARKQTSILQVNQDGAIEIVPA